MAEDRGKTLRCAARTRLKGSAKGSHRVLRPFRLPALLGHQVEEEAAALLEDSNETANASPSLELGEAASNAITEPSASEMAT